MKSFLVGAVFATLVPFLSFAEDSKQEPQLIVQDVQCKGNTATSCPFIVSFLYLSNGSKINEDEIQNAKLRLSSLANFKSVDIHLEKGSEVGQAIVVIGVVEASPISTEVSVGTILRNSDLSMKAAGRVSHQNLFGKGKILDFDIGARVPDSSDTGRLYSSRLQYVDPNVLGSKKFFLIGGISYKNYLYTFRDDYHYSTEELGADLSVGRRLWDFSYLTLGYQYRPISKIETSRPTEDGTKTTKRDSNKKSVAIAYGWNSEDDAFFPTRGSRFNLSSVFSTNDIGNNSATFYFGMSYRTSWQTRDNTIWTFKVGGNPGTEYRPSLDEDLNLSLAYSRPFMPKGIFGEVERGRWYVEGGSQRFGYSTYGGTYIDPGLKAGVRLDTKTFGIIDLYAIASTDWRIGGGK